MNEPSQDVRQDTTAEKFKDLRDAKPWQDMISDAEEVFSKWNDCCDNIDKEYASLERLRGGQSVDREFQIFWANLETLRPSIYARPPQPVVVPMFKDRLALPREASEVLERALIANAERDNVHRQYLAARDDLARTARGALWARYDLRHEKYEYACLEHVNRRDFLHEPARSWPEVSWVARRAFLTKDQGLKRFGEAFLDVKLSSKDNDTPNEYTFDKKAEVWEVWHKTLGVVCWVTPEGDKVLDVDQPHINFEGFFPCPEPAYGTKEPDSLIPIPDFLYYRDQVEEINELTGRIAALSESLRMKGFYAAGAEDLAAAIEKAAKSTDQTALLVPVAGGAAMNGIKGAVEWLPIKEVAETIAALVSLRKQLIEDVYQITGISDIMRGSTAATETATAQQLKSQYGSVRVRERQSEMVRLARDGNRLQGEIIAEKFLPQTIQQMTQTNLPSEQQKQQQIAQAEQQLAQVPPEQQAAGKAQLVELQQAVTFDQVIALFKDEHMRPFILDIETDSTIQPDEDAEKQRRTEFVTVVSQLLGQAMPMLEKAPETAPFVGEVLQFATAPFRAGRGLEGEIDDLVEVIQQRTSAPAPDPAAEAMKQKAEAETAKIQKDNEQKDLEAQRKVAESNARAAEIKASADAAQAKHAREMEALSARMAQDKQQSELKLEQMEAQHAAQMEAIAEKSRADLARINAQQHSAHQMPTEAGHA
ncbi:MAG: hypothetical protein AAFP81_16870 [Pseudomonadota bacterium]